MSRNRNPWVDERKVAFVKWAAKDVTEEDKLSYWYDPFFVEPVRTGPYQSRNFNLLDEIGQKVLGILGIDFKLHGKYPILPNKIDKNYSSELTRAMQQALPRPDKYPYDYARVVNDAWAAHVKSLGTGWY